MTGIERLHKLIADIDVSADPKLWYILRGGTEGGWGCEEHDDKTLGSTLAAIADQIEREHACDADTIENIRLIVGGVIDEMERHILGHEDMEDSPVARWARELQKALGGDGRDPAADVSVSAYDLLPQEDREAIAWVREHGGLDAVERRWECLSYYADPVPRSCMEKRLARLQRQIDECHEALRRRNQRIEELGHRVGDLTTENAKLRKRAMPESFEWPTFESGELVVLGDAVPKYVGGGTIKVRSIEFREGVTYLREGFRTEGIVVVRPGERVKRPSVPAADGEPLEVGQTVWGVGDGKEFEVVNIRGGMPLLMCRGGEAKYTATEPEYLTHARPVLDADGVEIRVGDRVWSTHLNEPHEWIVINPHEDRDDSQTVLVSIGDRTGHARPENLTHRAPVLAADGKPLREGQTVWDANGDKYTVDRVFSGTTEPDFPGHTVACRRPDDVVTHMFEPSQLTHERPVLGADGVPIETCQKMWRVRNGEEVRVSQVDRGEHPLITYIGEDGLTHEITPDGLTHTKPEPPDSWERIEEDSTLSPEVYCHRNGIDISQKDGTEIFLADTVEPMARDLVRRCRVLAERERGE